jgi:NTE family protein
MIGGRVAIVLGAGGPVGHAFHAGVLAAVESAGWDPRRASLVVGTSAGAQVAALLRAGMSGRDLCARVTGSSLSRPGAAIARHYHRPEQPLRRPRALAPSSLAYLRGLLRRPLEARPARMIAALLPSGDVSLEPQARGFRALFGDAWPTDPLWVSAVALDSGRAVAFGRPGSPRADVGSAVAGSCAVPGICAPVHIGAERYVDGGIASATHLDFVEADYDCVVVSSPLSMFGVMRVLLRQELKRLTKRGARTVVFEPGRSGLAAMGYNPMDTSRVRHVAHAAFRSAQRQLAGKSAD